MLNAESLTSVLAGRKVLCMC